MAPVQVLIMGTAARCSLRQVLMQQVFIDFIRIFGYYFPAFIYLNQFAGGFPWAK